LRLLKRLTINAHDHRSPRPAPWLVVVFPISLVLNRKILISLGASSDRVYADPITNNIMGVGG
jgi:hypothetical protein